MSLIIKMDAIKTEEHLRKSIPYIMNEKKTGGLCFSNSGITSEQIVDTFFLTKQIHPTLGTRQGYHFKFSFSKDETIEGEQALLFIKDWVDEYLTPVRFRKPACRVPADIEAIGLVVFLQTYPVPPFTLLHADFSGKYP